MNATLKNKFFILEFFFHGITKNDYFLFIYLLLLLFFFEIVAYLKILILKKIFSLPRFEIYLILDVTLFFFLLNITSKYLYVLNKVDC